MWDFWCLSQPKPTLSAQPWEHNHLCLLCFQLRAKQLRVLAQKVPALILADSSSFASQPCTPSQKVVDYVLTLPPCPASCRVKKHREELRLLPLRGRGQ